MFKANALSDSIMGKKRAIITVELVDESIEEKDKKIEQELIDWFRENLHFIPWVKDIKDITLKGE